MSWFKKREPIPPSTPEPLQRPPAAYLQDVARSWAHINWNSPCPRTSEQLFVISELQRQIDELKEKL